MASTPTKRTRNEDSTENQGHLEDEKSTPSVATRQLLKSQVPSQGSTRIVCSTPYTERPRMSSPDLSEIGRTSVASSKALSTNENSSIVSGKIKYESSTSVSGIAKVFAIRDGAWLPADLLPPSHRCAAPYNRCCPGRAPQAHHCKAY